MLAPEHKKAFSQSLQPFLNIINRLSLAVIYFLKQTKFYVDTISRMHLA